jgi:hypothetical protein
VNRRIARGRIRAGLVLGGLAILAFGLSFVLATLYVPG